MGEGWSSLEAVCQRRRLSARAFCSVWNPEAGRPDAGHQGPAIGSGLERSLPSGCSSLFQLLATPCPGLHAPAKSTTHCWCLAHPQRPPSPAEWCLAAGIVSTVCGRTNFQGKIYGGQKAASERWPWQASLLFRGSHICGAVLIDKNWVASTAHCFLRSRKPSDYRILLGYNQLGSPTNSSRQMTVNKLILHENYTKFHHQGNDIALIQLHRPVAYSSSIFPACIPENTMKVFQARSCWISGWGMLREDEFLPSPFPLQEAEVSLIDDKECETFFHTSESIGQYNIIKDDMICAGDVKNGKSICLGDTGGPLVCSLNGSWYLVGLGSWSPACLEPISSPNIFTKVSYYSNWIKKKKEETPDADPFSAPADENASTLVGWRSFNTGTILKPSICRALLSSQVLLLQSIWFQIP